MTADETLVADLAHYGLLQFAGADAQTFLQGQLSCDVAALAPGQALYGSYNTPKGRMLASFLLWRDDAGYTMQLPRALCEPLRKRLAMYILRAKVTAIDASDKFVLIGIAGTNAQALLQPLFAAVPAVRLALITAEHATLLRLDETRFQIVASPGRGREIRTALLTTAAAPASEAAWDLANIRAGIPYITPATQEEFVPQMANLDLIGGVSFTKGCYPGQEIVARMHYLGRLKQRMYLANIAGVAAAQPGDKLYSPEAGDQAVGMIVNAAPAPAGGTDALAVVQIASFQGDEVHLGSPTGPRLKFFALPYKIPV
jgi:folate-binding protein YgfZ